MTETGPPEAAKGRTGRARGADDAADHAGGRRRVAAVRRRAAGVDDAFDADPRPAPPVALYVHVPFCVSLCPYCDFVVIAGSAARGPSNRLAVFASALEREIGLRADALDARFGPPGGSGRSALDSVYLGGGTPSLMPPAKLGRLLDLISQRFGINAGAEITIEANPGPDERGDARAFVRMGVTRISFGAQSFNPIELRRLGRRHRPAHVADAVDLARAAGVGSINLDLLYDVPDSSLVSWMETLDAALAMESDHLSLYALTLDDPDAEGLTGPDGDHLPTRKGARRWRDLAIPQQDEDRAAAQYHHAVHRLAADGWRG
jgi:coproporphyrinogen III oxidase-like Fe-S oxidoreductase